MDILTCPTLNDLFAQLGLPNDDANISVFITMHKPLTANIELSQAPWWTQAQADFLQSALDDDAEWAIIVDELNDLLR